MSFICSLLKNIEDGPACTKTEKDTKKNEVVGTGEQKC